MAAVSPINTKDLLMNIKNRYNENIIFTNVGETLIITNPYQIIPGLYTEEKMKEIADYSKENSVERYERSQPHCFDTTMHSIFDLLNQSKNQALVISGESGAGKTECAKLCMKFIAYYFANQPARHTAVPQSAESQRDAKPVRGRTLAASGSAKQ